MSGKWDWVCLSPKRQKPPSEENYKAANELKVIIFDDDDLLWAEKCSKQVSENCILYLQPEWSTREKNTQKIIEYIKKNPKWKLSVQLHKYLLIP